MTTFCFAIYAKHHCDVLNFTVSSSGEVTSFLPIVNMFKSHMLTKKQQNPPKKTELAGLQCKCLLMPTYLEFGAPEQASCQQLASLDGYRCQLPLAFQNVSNGVDVGHIGLLFIVH